MEVEGILKMHLTSYGDILKSKHVHLKAATKWLLKDTFLFNIAMYWSLKGAVDDGYVNFELQSCG